MSGFTQFIANIIFGPFVKALQKKVQNDPELKKAKKGFEKASKKLDNTIKKRAELRKKLGFDK